MFAFNFGRKIRRVARRQRRRGKLNNADYKRIISASRDPETVIAWKTTIEKNVSGAPWAQKRGDDGSIFSRIWDWLVENWPAILKILLSLLVFAESPPSQLEKSDESKNDEPVDDEPENDVWNNYRP